MAGSPADARGRKRWFGPLDPFCMFAVGALLLLALLCVIGGLIVPTVIFVVLAVLVLPADKFWNRP